ncbi:MAG TPA: FCD domain-containing protein [Burkholderiales bacterium]|nr:FCD domain-containing protein [Burkholderiales bacterium]
MAAEILALRHGTMAARIVAEVREALFERRYRPGDFLGTEKELAARHGVSRIVARDALRTLEALGVVQIRPGLGGGARISPGNPQLFAEALAVQLELAEIDVEEILVAQHAIECLAAELAAKRASEKDIAGLKKLIQEAETALDDVDRFTRLSLAFHLAVADASRNRVLHYQLVSLQHVSWPSRNRTLTRAVALRVLEAHRQLVARIAARDAEGARRLMDEHVRMIHGRRASERRHKESFC